MQPEWKRVRTSFCFIAVYVPIREIQSHIVTAVTGTEEKSNIFRVVTGIGYEGKYFNGDQRCRENCSR